MREKVCLVCRGEGYIERVVTDENGNTKIIAVECEECLGRGRIYYDDLKPCVFLDDDADDPYNFEGKL